MRKLLILITILCVIPFYLSAQNISKRSKSASKSEQKIDSQMERMITATQDIIFIDSIVVDKDKFLSKYNLGSEAGNIYKYNDFFNHSDLQSNSFIYVNEIGNKCYFPIEDAQGNAKLYTSDKLNGNWTEPVIVEGLYNDKALSQFNYPFMMADGVTLYFAATGEESIGGLDIFATRFDADEGRFLEPENIGMPFNSEANDYMFAIDELNNIGWFVTDRNQTEGKVCIYIFIPSETRQTYSTDKYSMEEIKEFARISKISKTWKDGIERKNALNRLSTIQPKTEQNKEHFSFVINDNILYDKISYFRSKNNITQYRLLKTKKEQLSALDQTIEKARIYYITANSRERKVLKDEILKSEQQYDALEITISEIEKEIRNSENNLLNQNRL